MNVNHKILLVFLATTITSMHAMNIQDGFVQDFLSSNDNDLTKALFCVVKHKCPGIIKNLIDRGANVNAQDTAGMTPLHWAAGVGSTDTVQVLIKNKANINARDNEGCTPLHFAAASDNITMGGALLLADQKTENIYSQEVFIHLFKNADEEQILDLVKLCPRQWFLAALEDVAQEKKAAVVREITNHAIEEATERCKVQSESGRVPCYWTMKDQFQRLLLPDDSSAGVRKTFIRDQINKEFGITEE